MNYELGWRDVGIAPLVIAQHFSLFTLHFSLPLGTTFHFSSFTIHFPKGRFSLPLGTTFHFSLCTFNFPKGHFSLPEGTLFTLITQCGALALAARSDGTCSALRRASQRTAFLQGLLCVILCAVLLGVCQCSVRPFSLGRKVCLLPVVCSRHG